LRRSVLEAKLISLKVDSAEAAAWIAFQLLQSSKDWHGDRLEHPALQTASGDELVRLIHEVAPGSPRPILDNPALDETAPALLQRKDVQTNFSPKSCYAVSFRKTTPPKSCWPSIRTRRAPMPCVSFAISTDGFGAIRDFACYAA
jgi:hypothetical protein